MKQSRIHVHDLTKLHEYDASIYQCHPQLKFNTYTTNLGRPSTDHLPGERLGGVRTRGMVNTQVEIRRGATYGASLLGRMVSRGDIANQLVEFARVTVI
jgi:hypothetical protein